MPVASARVVLERPSARREEDFLRGVQRSRALHGTFVEPPSTREEYSAYLRRHRRKNQESFFVTVADSGDLAGVVNVNDIVRYSFLSATLGYYAFAPLSGRGLMREALFEVIGICFGELGLHRLEANIQPRNERSIALVRSLGFRFEGLSLRYLKIAGRWRDHQRWALLAEEWRPREVERRPP
jgi:[ribosomal protein S5]-alanine N-acetyltransferase